LKGCGLKGKLNERNVEGLIDLVLKMEKNIKMFFVEIKR
jgi:hypothetical protein